jgi:HD-GYP domain-containing protein (c-di-GMP phosphodiesterase class II)
MRERWDGGGYPDGLPGTQIPVLARILSVADAYDAMTSPRPYRDALSRPDALRQLWRERGRTYDPDVVEVFVMSQAPGRSD